MISLAAAANPAVLGMLFGKITFQTPSMVVLIDRDPGVNPQANLMSVADGLGKRGELRVVQFVELVEQLLAPRIRQISCKSPRQRLVRFRFRTPKAVFIPLAHGLQQLAQVERAAPVEHTPVNPAPATFFAG